MPEEFARLTLSAQEGAGFYFGVNVQAELQQWWDGPLREEMSQTLDGDRFDAVAVVQLAGDGQDWTKPLQKCLYCLGDFDYEGHVGPNGLFRDLAGVLRFAMRTGMEMSRAGVDVHLIEPGDYPGTQVIKINGLIVAVLGMMPGENLVLAERLGKKVADLRSQAVFMLDRKRHSEGVTPAGRYLGADPVSAGSPATFSIS